MRSDRVNRKQLRIWVISNLILWGGALVQALSFGNALLEGIPLTRASFHLLIGGIFALLGIVVWYFLPDGVDRSRPPPPSEPGLRNPGLPEPIGAEQDGTEAASISAMVDQCIEVARSATRSEVNAAIEKIRTAISVYDEGAENTAEQFDLWDRKLADIIMYRVYLEEAQKSSEPRLYGPPGENPRDGEGCH